MKKLNQLIKVAKTGAIFYQGKSNPTALPLVLNAADKCFPFVFLPFKAKPPKFKNTENPIEDMANFFGKAKEYMDSIEPKEVSEENHPIDPPFETFSMEYAGDTFITVGRPDDIVKVNTDCIMVEELDNQQYRYYMLLETKGYGRSVMIAEGEDAEKSSGIVASMLDKLNNNNCGTEKNKLPGISYRPEGSKKKRYVSKDIVFIVADNPTKRSSELKNREINWSHAFDVRGHWRYYKENPDFIGYDRKGNKNQKGRTWVSHYQKNKDKELRNKVRVLNP